VLPMAALAREPWIPASPAGWATLLALALASQVAGRTLILYALRELSVLYSSVSLMLQPILSAILAWAVLGESLSPAQLAGGGAVLAGVLLVQWQGLRGERS
jgi:drug/metabolite transporter (DMT)-like permease